MTAKRLTRKRAAIKLPRSIRRLHPQVTEAYDADKPVEISVNRKDCKIAKKLDPTQCALAQAAKREMHADAVIIGLTSSYLIKGKTALRYATPESVQREIVSFDRHQDFAPGDYHLAVISPSLRMGADKRGRRKLDPKRNKNATRKTHTSVRVRVLPKGSEGETPVRKRAAR